MSKTEEKQKPVVFWMWQEVDPETTPKKIKAVASQMTLHVSGGELHIDANGRKFMEPHVQVQFKAGKLETSDPAVIAAVRKLMADGERNIVEGDEGETEYLRHVAEPLSLKKTTAKLEEAKKENADLRQKNKDLAEKLAGLRKLEAAEEALADALTDKPAAAGA
jgi:hypothetical protein